MDSVTGSPPPSPSSPPPKKRGSEDGSKERPQVPEAYRQTSKGEKAESASLVERRAEHSSEKTVNPLKRRADQELPLPPGKYRRIEPEQVRAYLDKMLETFKFLAWRGRYQDALDCCQTAINWMKETNAQDKDRFDRLSACRNGCCFACNLLRNFDRSDLWVQKQEHVQWGVNFIQHVLVETGRYQEPDCEFDLGKTLQIVNALGEARSVSNSHWHGIFDRLADMFECEEFIHSHKKTGATATHSAAAAALPLERQHQVGGLFEQYETYKEKLDKIALIASKEEQDAALDELTLGLKQYCAKNEYHPDTILEAGAFLLSLHHECLKGTPAGNRVLRIVSDFGMASFGVGHLQFGDLSRSAIALCKWRLPAERTGLILRDALDTINRLQHQERKITPQESEKANKAIRESFANAYGLVLPRKQEEVDALMERGDFSGAKEKLLKLLEERYFHSGELSAVRLQLAACYAQIDEFDRMVSSSLEKVMNKGFFGIRKAEILFGYDAYFEALDVLEQVKRKTLEDKDDFGTFSVEYLLKLEADIQQKMISKGLLPKRLYPNKTEIDAALVEMTEKLDQLKFENRRLERRVKAKRLNYAEEDKRKDAMQEQLQAQAEKIRTTTSQLTDAESQRDRYKNERDKLRKEVAGLTVKVQQLTLHSQKTSSQSDQYKKLAEIQQIDRKKAMQYRGQREELNVELLASQAKVKQQQAELDLMRTEMAGLKKLSEAQRKKINPPLIEGPSQIAGDGLFAGDDIPIGTALSEYTGERVYRLFVPKTGRYVLWHNVNGAPEFLDRDYHIVWVTNPHQKKHQPEVGIDAELINLPTKEKSPLRLMNHSKNYNVQMLVTPEDRVFAMSCRSISEGDELFWSYDTGRKELFNLMEHEEHVLHRQDHIERWPEDHVLIDPQTGDVSLDPDSAKKGHGKKNKPLWR